MWVLVPFHISSKYFNCESFYIPSPFLRLFLEMTTDKSRNDLHVNLYSQLVRTCPYLTTVFPLVSPSSPFFPPNPSATFYFLTSSFIFLSSLLSSSLLSAVRCTVRPALSLGGSSQCGCVWYKADSPDPFSKHFYPLLYLHLLCSSC